MNIKEKKKSTLRFLYKKIKTKKKYPSNLPAQFYKSSCDPPCSSKMPRGLKLEPGQQLAENLSSPSLSAEAYQKPEAELVGFFQNNSNIPVQNATLN